MWHDYLGLEIACEFALYYRGYIDECDRQRQLAHWEGIVGRLEFLQRDDRVVIGGYCIDCGTEVGVSITGYVHQRCSKCERQHAETYAAHSLSNHPSRSAC